MFLLQLRKYSITRCLMSSNPFSKSIDPGVGRQINAIEDAAEVIQSDPEGFGDLETDLFKAHKSHKEHELELKRQREKNKQYLVKHKYFRKEQLPNLLTYSEKERIKSLHSSDQEWTAEKLAESFPASAEIISKILKSNWKPISLKRIHSHDDTVSENWERFNNGEFKTTFTPDLYEHLKKFAGRKVDTKNPSYESLIASKVKWQKPISNEFLSIVTPLHKQRMIGELPKSLKPNVYTKATSSNNTGSDTCLLGKVVGKRAITIRQLKEKHLLNENDDSGEGSSTNSPEQLQPQQIENSERNSFMLPSTTIDYTNKFVQSEIVISESDRNRYEMNKIKHRIYIPQKLRRRGATYKANDCYYDDDGEFLYKLVTQ